MRTTDSRHDTAVDTRPHSSERADQLDATLDALADRRCRSALDALADSDDDALLVGDLAARLDGWPGDAGEYRLRSQLHHSVLPKLDAADLLAYDADRGIVRRRPDSSFEAVRSAIDAYEDGHADAVALDELFDLLSAYRRRTAYRLLLRHDDLSLPDLADEVAVEECDQPLSKVDADRVLKVYLSLYHTHVPKLGDAGLVAYDQDDDYVALTETGRALESSVRELLDAADA